MYIARNTKIHDNLKPSLWMKKKLLLNVFNYYNIPFSDDYNFTIIIKDKDYGVLYCKLDDDYGIYSLTDDDDSLIKYIYTNQDLFID